MRDDSMRAAMVEALESRTLLSVDPVLVKDIVIGAGGSNPTNFVNVNGTLFFTANDGMNGTELWQSDGTATGTTLVKDIRNGSSGSDPSLLTNVNGTLFFRANNGLNGYELWQSDGTSAGTTLVNDINSGSNSSSPSFLTNVNGTLFFRANNGLNGIELWRSDGTSAGTTLVKDIRIQSSSNLNNLTNVNGTLFFRANDGVNGYELWQSDGTAAGTTLVKDIRSGSSGTELRYLTNVNGTLFFSANDGVNGYELWQSDGTAAGTTLVKDIRSGDFSSLPRYLTNVNGTLFFRADDGVNGEELWQSDGTSAGTTLVKDIRSGSYNNSYPRNLTNVNGTLFFSANDGVNGEELWQSDGTSAGTTLVKNIFGVYSSGPNSLTNVNGTLFFRASDQANGIELWQSDGTSAGTTLVKDIRSGHSNSYPNHLRNVNGMLFFSADDGTNGTELWSMPVNSPPGLTAFAAAVDTALEDTEVELTFSELAAQGDESDADGTVDAFIVQAVTSGTLKIGTSAASATAFAVGSNDRIDAIRNAYWTPAANVSGNAMAAFSVLAQDNIGDNSNLSVTASITVTAVADRPSVTNATTTEEVQSTSGLVISRNSADGAEVTHFKITSITGGSLFQNDGTTAIADNEFITFDQANAGLRFTPSLDSTTTGHFTVQASTSNLDGGLGGSTVTAGISIDPVADTPSVTDAATSEDVQTTSGLVILRNAADGAEVTHFKITSITGGALFQNDGTTAIADNEFITFAQANAGLRFTPSLDSTTTGHFTVQASTSNLDGGLGGSTVTASITVTAVADRPNVTNATTLANTQTTSGLVITRNAGDGSEVTHFKITSITGGTLFQNNGTTPIANGTFITAAQANAGLRFTPAQNSLVTGHFSVQASKSNADAGLGGSIAVANITITAAPIGTAGSDVFVLTYSGTAPAGTVSVTISTNNGAMTAFGTFPMNALLTINGLGGTDSVRIVGTSGADKISVNSSTGLVVNGATLMLTSIENCTLAGAAGNDVYQFDADSVLGLWSLDEAGGGTDTIDFSFTAAGVALNLETAASQVVHTSNLSLILGAGTTFENTVGGSGADTLIGNRLANTISGGAGNDKLTGGGGSDVMFGGLNDDTYFFSVASSSEADQVHERVDEGLDTLNFSAMTASVVVSLGTSNVQNVHTNRTLKLNSSSTFEHLQGGSAGDTLTGNALNNTLIGGAGNDSLTGAAGSDTMFGGLNDDSYLFAAATTAEADQVHEKVNEGTDTLNFAAITMGVVVSLGTSNVQNVHTNRTLKLNTSTTFENLTGGIGADTLFGSTVANRLIGGNGNNILVGSDGSDILEAGTGRDILIGGLGLDKLNGGSGDDILIAGRTTSDTNAVNMNTLRTAWISANTYASRIANLRAGVGSPLVSLKAKVNALNDAGEDDILTGGANSDWYFRAVDDAITDLFAGELIGVL
jgi:ELWxxDGT repeat protein